MESGWRREEGVIAERYKKNEIPSFIKKHSKTNPNEFLVFEKGGEIYLEIGLGDDVSRKIVEGSDEVMLVDKSEKTMQIGPEKIYLPDGMGMGVSLEIKFRVFNSEHFSKNLMGERKRFFMEDVRDEIESDVLSGHVLPRLQKKLSKDFANESLRKKIASAIEKEIKDKFKSWGLLTGSVSVTFSMDSMPAQTENYENEEEAEALKPTINIEKEKTPKEKMDEEEETKNLEEELKNLKRAKELTEKKFYRKELSQESFQRLMEDFERRIIEIETKLKKE